MECLWLETDNDDVAVLIDQHEDRRSVTVIFLIIDISSSVKNILLVERHESTSVECDDVMSCCGDVADNECY